MSRVKIKVSAVVSLLTCFFTVGAILIGQETSPEKPPSQSVAAENFQQNLFGFERADAFKPQENSPEAQSSHTSFVLWILGMPLAALGGLAIGLILRSRPNRAGSPLRGRVEYILLNPPRAEEIIETVPKQVSDGTQQDSSDFVSARPADSEKSCRTRFRFAASFARRENQPR